MDEALHLAREGVLLEPDNQLSHLALARAHFLQNELDQALNDVETALALQPESLLFMDSIGYMLLLLAHKPNFTERARLLIGHYIKFPDITERLIEGLSVAGLDID